MSRPQVLQEILPARLEYEYDLPHSAPNIPAAHRAWGLPPARLGAHQPTQSAARLG